MKCRYTGLECGIYTLTKTLVVLSGEGITQAIEKAICEGSCSFNPSSDDVVILKLEESKLTDKGE